LTGSSTTQRFDVMTPSPAASHAAETRGIAFRSRRKALVARTMAQLLDPRAWARMRFVVDVVVLCLACGIALLAATPIRNATADIWLGVCFTVVVLAMLYARRGPDQRLQGSMLDTVGHVLGVVSLAAMLTVAVVSLLGDVNLVGLTIRLWLFAAVYLGIERAVLLSVRRAAVKTDALATPTLIVGAGVVGERLVTRLSQERAYGLRPVGFLDSHPLPKSDRYTPVVPVLGGLDDLSEAIDLTGARHVILAFSAEPDHVLVQKVEECQLHGVEVSLVPRLFESINARATLDHVGGLPLLSLRPTDPRGWQFALKHALDRGFAALALIALAPLMLLIAIGVRISSPGTVLFRQRRVGRDGHVFDLVKFRTMRDARDEDEFDLPDGCAPGGVEGEDRRTRFGQWLRRGSLDELPQLINVLRGDMSLVGPRPERPEFVERFAVEVNRYQQRHRVKSGITGWAQVHGLRGQTSIDDRVEWDNYYIQNWSLRLDLRIIALTVAEILRFRKNA
jgi:exopolysaccharide biosynthesis polyprenyl glycosylphosphotransferase